ncbi:MAG TPA: tetratricopeptide repeat protein, partial [Chitinophagaceae bacterium]|nr:tetratricopeptide repeat protein [Chitinophagaceae bacterium]
IILIGFLAIGIIAPAQKKLGLEPDKWAAELSKNRLTEVNSLGSLTNLLIEADSLRALRFLDSLETSDNAKGYFFRTYFCMVKADFLYAKFAGYDKYKDRGSKELQPIKEQMMKLYADAIDAVYHTERDLAIGWVSFYSARRMRSFGETGWAVMYSKNGVDFFEKDGYDVEPPVYTELAELLYQVREYDECIIYAKKGIAAWKKREHEKGFNELYKYKIRALNSIGTTFYRKNQHDSANAYYQQALQLAKENKDTVWTGIVLGNIGRIMYAQNNFDSAYFLFKTDYQSSKADSIYDNAANASDWAARTNLARGNKVAALAEAREAIRLLGLWPSGPYLRDTYYTLTQVSRAMGNYDSAFYYNDRYIALNDSLEKEVATSSLAISKARLHDEISRYSIQKLNREKRSQLQFRNFAIIFIVLASIIALLYINRLRLRHRHKEQLALQQKNAAETMAREQLRLVTQNLMEKTSLADELQRQLNNKEVSAERQELASTISSLTILTETDWEKFKSLFEQLYPGFFMNLQEKVNDITLAELRMAALTRLRISTHQIASILGISANSVYKTKQRLRQRLNLPAESSIEEFIAGI